MRVLKKGLQVTPTNPRVGAVGPFKKQETSNQKWDNQTSDRTRPGVPSGTVADINVHCGNDMKRSLTIVKAYLFSKGCFQCSTWPFLSHKSFSLFNTSIFKVYRVITGKQYDPYSEEALPSDFQIIQDFDLVNPQVLISSARILLLARIILKNVTCLSS